MADIDQELLEQLYAWVDKIPLSKPKKNIQRDFSDGVLVAEVVRHHVPSYVELHNFPSCFNTTQKMTNWHVLNRKVFKKLGFEITEDVMRNIVNCKPMAIEQFLMMLRRKLDRYMYEAERNKVRNQGHVSDRPEADQHMPSKTCITDSSAVSDAGHHGSTGHMARSKFGGSNHDLSKLGMGGVSQNSPSPHIQHSTGASGGGHHPLPDPRFKGEMVPKLVVEEREQELLAKEETIQILQAKVRRLEHLLHLKDIRIDDLQGRLDRMEIQLRPTANRK